MFFRTGLPYHWPNYNWNVRFLLMQYAMYFLVVCYNWLATKIKACNSNSMCISASLTFGGARETYIIGMVMASYLNAIRHIRICESFVSVLLLELIMPPGTAQT
jgi:hypothetical protein